MTRPAVSASPSIRAMGGAAVLLLIALTIAHPSATRMHTWPWAQIAAIVWLVPAAWLVVRIVTRRRWRLPDPLITAGGTALLLGAVGSAAASPFAAASFARVWPTVSGIALYFLLHHWLASSAALEQRRELVARLLGASGAIVIAASLVGWLRFDGSSPFGSRNAIPFGHSTYTGGFVVLILPWLVARAWAGAAAARLAWSFLCAAALIVLAGTSSRGAVLALVATSVFAAGAALLRAPWKRSRKLLAAAGLVVLGLLMAMTNPRLRALALHGAWNDSARASNQQRSAMFVAGIVLGQQRPLLGWGPGTVPLAYPRVRAQLDGGVDNVLQLHHTLVQIWATLGSAGVLATLLLLVGSVRATARALRHRAKSPALLAAVASLGGYGLFALTDHQFDLPIIGAMMAANLALITSASGSRERQAPARWRALLALGLGAVLARPTFSLGRELLARRHYEHGVSAWEHGREADFLIALARASELAPHDPYFRHQAASAMLRMAEKIAPRTGQRELTQRAIAMLEASLASGAHQEFAHFNLGWLQLGLDRPAEAARHFRAAAQLVPDKGGVYFGLGLALQAAGETPAAVRAFALEWINDPRSLTSPAWEIPALAALRPAVRVETGRLLTELAQTHPPASRLAAWIRWWHGEPVPSGEMPPALNSGNAALVQAWPALAARQPIAPDAPWAKLYAAWRDAENPNAFASATGGDQEFAAALARRAARHREDFQAFLTAGTEDEPALVRTLRRQRIGYGVLALHPAGPILMDQYLVQENRLVSDFAAGLFPAKGWLPGRFLLALLPAVSLSNGLP